MTTTEATALRILNIPGQAGLGMSPPVRAASRGAVT